MPTEDGAPVVVQASHASEKMRGLLRERLRQLLRVTLALTIGLAVAAGAFAIWWSSSLNGLPDIGEPFDVEAFLGFSVPDDRNAFAYLRLAHEKTVPLPGIPLRLTPGDPNFSWPLADPRLREWGEANREAFDLFQRGADQPDASHPAGEPAVAPETNLLWWVALLEGSKRREGGDTAGSFECYRSMLRMITHFRRRGSTVQRLGAKGASLGLQRRLADWAADPRTTIPQLHSALEEALRNEPNPNWDISAIKCGYVELMREVEQPLPLSAQQEIEGEWTFRLGDLELSPGMVGHLEAARRVLLREPERSRRFLRLLCASYLARAEARELPPQKPAVWAKFAYATSPNPFAMGKFSVPLYPVSPGTSAGARALPPEELARWLVSTLDARLRLLRFDGSEWPWPPDRAPDPRTAPARKSHRDLVLMLATELYRHERGSLPASDEALVGTYLKDLPDDRAPDLDDGTTPIVE
jgi:hypothetical protein